MFIQQYVFRYICMYIYRMCAITPFYKLQIQRCTNISDCAHCKDVVFSTVLFGSVVCTSFVLRYIYTAMNRFREKEKSFFSLFPFYIRCFILSLSFSHTEPIHLPRTVYAQLTYLHWSTRGIVFRERGGKKKNFPSIRAVLLSAGLKENGAYIGEKRIFSPRA